MTPAEKLALVEVLVEGGLSFPSSYGKQWEALDQIRTLLAPPAPTPPKAASQPEIPVSAWR